MPPQPAQPLELFYSYSHKDEELRDQLENHLAMLKREGIIKGWHDRRIGGGREWAGEIDEHLDSADIILLLTSADFLASDYCYDIEVKRAMERHEAGEARVIPVILRPCDWMSAPFGRLQALPKDAKPIRKWDDEDEAFLDVAKGIRATAKEINEARLTDSSLPPEASIPSPSFQIPNILKVAFVPRKDSEGQNIVERLKDELAPGKNRLVALWGAGGVGKTAIAAEVARALVDAFNQRVVWISADGREGFNLSELLDGIAAQLGEADLRKLALELRKEQVREVLQASPALVVLDNFETIAPEEAARCAEWLAQPALCSALITTRQNVEAAHRNIPLKEMRLEEAHDLLQQLIAEAHERRAFTNLDRERVIETADFNPLVLQWIVGQIDLAQDPDEVLDELAHGEGTAAQRVFDRSFNLPQLNQGGRAVLLALSLFVPSATRSALAEVSGMSKEKDKKRFKEAVKTLSSLWLIRTTEDQRLTIEGLTREFTKARLSKDPRGKTFCQRFVARFLHYSRAHQQHTAADFNTLEAEKDNLLAAMDIAFAAEDWKSVQAMANVLANPTDGVLCVRGYWEEAIQRGEQAEAAARSAGNKWNVAQFAGNTATIRMNRGEYYEARQAYQEALSVFQKLNGEQNVAAILHLLGILEQDQGELEEARRLYDESLEINRKLGNQTDIASTLHQLAMLTQDQGKLEEARRLYDESLEIERKRGNQSGIASTLHQLATLAQGQGKLEEARRLYDESLEIKRKLGNQSGIASTLHQLGRLAEDQGELEEARRLYDESLEIERKLGNQSGIAISLGQLGLLAEKQGNKGEAARLFREALAIFERLRSPFAEKARRSLARVEGEIS